MNWRHKIIFRDLTAPFDGRDLTDEEAKELAKKFAQRINESTAMRDYSMKRELKELVRQFEQDVFDEDDLNVALDDLYDFGDLHHVWIGNTNLDLVKELKD